MEREGDAVMVAVLESLVEEEPFHSSTMISADATSMADCFSASVDLEKQAIDYYVPLKLSFSPIVWQFLLVKDKF